MSIRRRLRALEEGHDKPAEDPLVAEARRTQIREQALHTNRCQGRDELPLFEVTEDGDVLCARDGRPVTDPRGEVLLDGSRVGWLRAGPRRGGGGVLL
jgi:hypothetical protein